MPDPVAPACWCTLDFVRYLGRRLYDVQALLLLTYRSDELEVEHPLRRVLGELPGATTTRLAIERLSAGAVAALAARSGRSPRLFEATHGNPFYLTELLADGNRQGVPPSVTDAVLAVLARLPAAGPRAGRSGERVARSDRCRPVSVLQSLDPQRRIALHTAVFAALRDDQDVALARRVHHAEGAALVDAVAALAPRAARHAAASGVHREAERLYALALRYGTALAPAERADMLEAHGLECALTGRHAQAIRARKEALHIHRQLGDRRREGIDLRWLARPCMAGATASTKHSSTRARRSTFSRRCRPTPNWPSPTARHQRGADGCGGQTELRIAFNRIPADGSKYHLYPHHADAFHTLARSHRFSTQSVDDLR